ncbi:glycosyltransferase family 2 protein [Actinocatenispora sera]|uniref:Cellulose synthase/poly-beta-1,6-N-acetylglucosamine synthase-like glycosyltransferase n=1 Tax=Actinocatenispora sera TaxID=390989 RepID=A0A810L8L9_9ACTN|nr:glycosyltransferase family 2 protein [Actinocatenispora sera]BCJ31559.1 hypothetical protein Asera_56670 [Actinocatenispora sera]
MFPWLLLVFVFGLNFTLWGLIGLLRLIDDRFVRRHDRPDAAPGPRLLRDPDAPRTGPIGLEDVAVLMPAHNESVVLAASITAVQRLVPAGAVHVVSDGSTDDTVAIARRCGARVLATPGNLGKAGALQYAMRRFGLVRRYRAVLLLDADTQLDDGYFDAALPLFDDPAVVAVAGCARTHWSPDTMSHTGQLIVAHRERIYTMTQRLLKYGQTWRSLNATHIVPGFASLYRTEILPRIEMNPAGLVIEDFNMTFEVYRRRLGRVGFRLGAAATTQDPGTFRDYLKQTTRWSLGLWQTVRRHGLRPNLFSVSLGLTLLELVSSSLLFLLLPLLFVVLVVPELAPAAASLPGLSTVYATVHSYVRLETLAVGVLLPDYLTTLLVAALQRRPKYLLFLPFFVLLRVVDAAITLYTLPRAFVARSTGRWVSPTRRPPEPVDGPSTLDTAS